MNNYDLTYLKEYLNTYYQTKEGYIMSYDEVDKIYHYIERITSNWNELKQFINTNCFYDNDTITYGELMDKIMYLENKGE